MDIEKIEYKNIGETLYIYTHSSGLKAFVVPKKGYYKKYAGFGTHYGSINNKFIIPGETEETFVPDGIAHFLEHKLFEQEDGSVMDKFSALGSQPNAYTSFTQTVYLFSCTDKFMDNFNLLLKYVQNPYLTDENVEKEKGIIAQEIKMYEDNPGWRAFFNLLHAMYIDHPAKIDIAGTVDSISKIDKETLYKCYNTFYHPSNMVITVAGDVDYMEVFEAIEKSLKHVDKIPEIKRIFPQEDHNVAKKLIEQQMEVSMPMFQIGFKEICKEYKGKAALKREVCLKILLELLAGKSSSLFNYLYNEGLINGALEYEYNLETNYGYSIIGGDSESPEKVRDCIYKEIEKIKSEGLNETDFIRTKNSYKGNFIRKLNSVESIANSFVSAYFKGSIVFDYIEAYDNIDLKFANDLFKEHFDLNKSAMSLIRPK